MRPAPILIFGVLLLSCPIDTRGESTGPERRGFTALITVGSGMQTDSYQDLDWTTSNGVLIGASIGGFITPTIALMARTSGTTVSREIRPYEVVYTTSQQSRVGVLAGQFWLTRRLNVEAGAGIGYVHADIGNDDVNETGFGLLAAVGYSVLLKTKHSLQLGIEYAPVLHGGRKAQNISLNLGFQFF